MKYEVEETIRSIHVICDLFLLSTAKSPQILQSAIRKAPQRGASMKVCCDLFNPDNGIEFVAAIHFFDGKEGIKIQCYNVECFTQFFVNLDFKA